MEAPYVAVDATEWMAAHPGTSLQACLDGVCQAVTGQPAPAGGVHLYLSGQAVAQPLTVAVRATRAAVTVLDTAATARLQHLVISDGGCGGFGQWAAAVTLDSTGQLHRLDLPRTVTVGVGPRPSSD